MPYYALYYYRYAQTRASLPPTKLYHQLRGGQQWQPLCEDLLSAVGVSVQRCLCARYTTDGTPVLIVDHMWPAAHSYWCGTLCG
eukprot:scaffold148261_cov18-Tisochrysis_lutea.AAC.1